jgi:putative GTP pyrophosphokinase
MAKIDSQAWEDDFRARVPLYERLRDEVIFALRNATAAEGIKTHLVHGRVKELESLAEKVRNNEYGDPLSQVNDIVGVRAVVLFLSDLPILDEIVTRSFEVTAAENKVTEGDPASFGYMSVHYLATLKDHHSGPRYDDLQGIQFEIQTRTIVMDAWANVSHYLDYKGRSSVPEELRRDFFALSGLFYVADQHFELFAERASESQERAEEVLQEDAAAVMEINLDTVSVFIANRYFDREHSPRPPISAFVEEISAAGLETLGELRDALNVGDPLLERYERDFPPAGPEESSEVSPPRYQDLGAARISLALASKTFADLKYPGDDGLAEFSAWP